MIGKNHYKLSWAWGSWAAAELNFCLLFWQGFGLLDCFAFFHVLFSSRQYVFIFHQDVCQPEASIYKSHLSTFLHCKFQENSWITSKSCNFPKNSWVYEVIKHCLSCKLAASCMCCPGEKTRFCVGEKKVYCCLFLKTILYFSMGNEVSKLQYWNLCSHQENAVVKHHPCCRAHRTGWEIMNQAKCKQQRELQEFLLSAENEVVWGTDSSITKKIPRNQAFNSVWNRPAPVLPTWLLQHPLNSLLPT